MKRNWNKIAKLSDKYLRIAISLAADNKVLAGYEKGFPELFEEGEDGGSLKIPLSVLKEAAARGSLKEFPDDDCLVQDQNFMLDLGLKELNIPVPLYKFGFDGRKIPSDLAEQLIGQKALAGMTMKFAEKQCMVINIAFNKGQEVGSIFEITPDITQLSLIDAEFIDFDI